MSRSVPEDVHTNAVLTGFGIRYKNAMYAAGAISPNVPVDKLSNLFRTFGADVWYRDEAEEVAAGDPSPTVSFDLSTGNYRTVMYKIKMPIPQDVRDNADSDIQMQAMASELVAEKMLLRKEIQTASIVFEDTAGTTWGGDSIAAGARWDTSGANIVKNVDDAMDTVEDATGGARPNKMIVGANVWKAMKRDPSLIGYVFAGADSGPKLLTKQNIAAVFELDEIIVGRAYKNTNVEGNATQTKTRIWGNSVWLGFVDSNPNMLSPTALKTFQWKQYTRGWYNEDVDTDFVEQAESFVVIRTSAVSGFQYGTVVG